MNEPIRSFGETELEIIDPPFEEIRKLTAALTELYKNCGDKGAVDAYVRSIGSPLFVTGENQQPDKQKEQE